MWQQVFLWSYGVGLFVLPPVFWGAYFGVMKHHWRSRESWAFWACLLTQVTLTMLPHVVTGEPEKGLGLAIFGVGKFYFLISLGACLICRSANPVRRRRWRGRW